MLRLFPRTREREKAWKLGGICFGAALVAAPFVTLIFRRRGTGFMEVNHASRSSCAWLTSKQILWTFSIINESVCVLPQLLLLRQTTVPTVIDSFYLVTLGTYRAFYILNWIFRWATEWYFDPIAVIFGIVQTALYVDFAWVYWTRQRVKLRNGGVVDSEDLSRGWLVSRLLGRGRDSFDEEDGHAENAGANGITKTVRGGWGARGVSVSADEQVLDPHHKSNGVYTEDARARDTEVGNDPDDVGAHGTHNGFPADNPTEGNGTNGLSNDDDGRNRTK